MNDISFFRKDITVKINEFKRIHRRNLSPKIRESLSLSSLNITRKQTKEMSDIDLYNAAMSLTKTIDTFQNGLEKRHAGLDIFMQTMLTLLSEYVEYNQNIIHKSNFCNKHMINIIQHVHSLQHSINNRSLHAIKESGQALVEFGDQDSTSKLIEIMKENKDQSRYFAQLAVYFENLNKAYNHDPLLL